MAVSAIGCSSLGNSPALCIHGQPVEICFIANLLLFITSNSRLPVTRPHSPVALQSFTTVKLPSWQVALAVPDVPSMHWPEQVPLCCVPSTKQSQDSTSKASRRVGEPVQLTAEQLVMLSQVPFLQ